MKDIPMFTTQFGIASLSLHQIPYRGEAYIRLQATEQPAALLEECVSFCRACGAQRILATGQAVVEQYPLYTAVVQLCCPVDSLPRTDAALFPVLPETLENWRSIYNERMANVPAASFMTEKDARTMLDTGDGYFVHRDGQLLGIGKASGGKLEAIASVVPGGGRDVVLALASLPAEESLCVEVATANTKAIRLYESLGFTAVRELVRWYCIKEYA